MVVCINWYESIHVFENARLKLGGHDVHMRMAQRENEATSLRLFSSER